MSYLLRRLSVAAIALLLAVSGSIAPAAAHSTSDRQTQIEREKAALREKIRAADTQAKNLLLQIAQSDARKAALERQIASLTSQLAQAERRLAEAEEALAAARGDLLAVESTLATTLGRLDDMRSRLGLRARRSYQTGYGVYVEMLLAAEDFRDFISRLTFVRKVLAEDQARVSRVERLTQLLGIARDEAEQRKTEISLQKEAIEIERARIAGLQQQLQTARRQVVAEIAARQKLLEKVRADKASYLEAMRRLEQESRSIAALLKARQRGQVYQAGSGTRLAWPTTGQVVSGYGWRTHPIFGDRRFHTGIDIGAPTGQAVVAAESGTVAFAGYRSGYGLTVVIDHGDALATLYAHLSSVSVSNGSRVARASRVAAVGCSGYCTGPHLHFETRINGEPRDPMQFF